MKDLDQGNNGLFIVILLLGGYFFTIKSAKINDSRAIIQYSWALMIVN